MVHISIYIVHIVDEKQKEKQLLYFYVREIIYSIKWDASFARCLI